MSAGTASLCYNLLFFSVFVFVSADQKTITAESGQDVTLTCRAPNNNITAVHWSRADLKDKYVLLYQDKQFVPDDQHPSFKNRVDLQDRQMKDGDVSLILKDVTTNDTGTYGCHVLVNVTDSWKLVSIINLRVSPGQTGGQEKERGKMEEVKKEDGKKEEGKKEEGKKEEGKKEEGKKEEGKKHEVKKEEGKKEEGKKEEGKKEEGKKEGGKKHEVRQEDKRRMERRRKK
ncbi:pheromone-processing carboxypeptidase KEX1-like [Oreochromis aureus]|uniref:pheromone-processing carboxypeptidase KEX1-like n=1 Tax=Oreochromis aureus TaxID=47969 RepID=UPI001952CF2E|nr:pheromone-processing carboxypeptidase KEX1-like [Oreochromis aureus]